MLGAGVMFTAANTPVVDGNGNAMVMNNGLPRLGKGFAESTFRKHYHALRTLHVHFQQETEPKVYDVHDCYLKLSTHLEKL